MTLLIPINMDASDHGKTFVDRAMAALADLIGRLKAWSGAI
jgi:hypothetical protein